MTTIYLAHPMNVYNTSLQQQILTFLNEEFPHWKILNPDQEEHEKGFQRYLKERNNPMAYFEEVLLPQIHGCVGLPFLDGMIPAGVAFEMFRTAAKGFPVWLIKIKPRISLQTIPRFPENCLSIEETMGRVFNPDGGFLPYKPY